MAKRDAARAYIEAAPIFAALGDVTRLQVVAKLCADGPQSIVSLTQTTRITRQGVTKHLRVLEGAGLVRSSRNGRENVYELAPNRLTETQRLLTQIAGDWDEALGRLRRFVEDDG